MPQTTQDKRGIWLPNATGLKWSSFYSGGDRPSGGSLVASTALDGDGEQEFSISGATWHTNAWNGGSLTRTGGYIALTNPANAEGGVYTLVGIECTPLALSDYYIDFEIRYPSNVWGSKFCKFHGAANVSGNGANCTFGQNDVGDLTYIGYGDGVELGQDVNQSIDLNGTLYMGRNAGIADFVVSPIGRYLASSFAGNVWRRVRVHAKFNTGTTAMNEVPDGEFYLEIDNIVYCHVRNIYNRHYLNPPVAEINIGGWTAGGSAFTYHVRNVRISTGGFM